MDSLEKARNTQIKNIEEKTSKTLSEIQKMITKSGLEKHGEIREFLKKELNLGYGDANSLVHYALKSDGQSAAEASGASLKDLVREFYIGKKEVLLPIHEKAMKEIHKLGKFNISPKKNYISLRRKKQFAMIGPGTKGRLEIGLNMKNVTETSRLIQLPPGGMCQYKVFISEIEEIDNELLIWVKIAFDRSA